MENTEFTEQISAVNYYLLRSAEYGLQSEVVAYALKFMKENPDLSIRMAMEYAYNEWIK